MRITHVITRLIIGGAQENTIASVQGLQNRPGMQVDLISGPTHGPEGSLENVLLASNPQILTIVPELVRPVSPLRDFMALRRLRAIFLKTRPQIVHTHSGKAGILGRYAAHAAGVPIIVHTIHGPSFGPFQGPLANLAFQTAERFAGRITTHFVSVADAMTQQYLAAGIGRPERYSRIFSGFPLAPYLKAQNDPKLRARFGIDPADIVIGKIARLFELKGHDDLIDVAPDILKKVPQAKFLFVGDGIWRQRLLDRVRALGLKKHFIFSGLVTPEEIPHLLGIMDLVVHLSRREGLPRALSQAAAAGRPLLAYDCDGAKEICLDAKTGFLIDPADRAALRDKMLLLAESRELRAQFAAEAQRFAQQHFSVEQMVENLHALYCKLHQKAALRN